MPKGKRSEMGNVGKGGDFEGLQEERRDVLLVTGLRSILSGRFSESAAPLTLSTSRVVKAELCEETATLQSSNKRLKHLHIPGIL